MENLSKKEIRKRKKILKRNLRYSRFLILKLQILSLFTSPGKMKK